MDTITPVAPAPSRLAEILSVLAGGPVTVSTTARPVGTGRTRGPAYQPTAYAQAVVDLLIMSARESVALPDGTMLPAWYGLLAGPHIKDVRFSFLQGLDSDAAQWIQARLRGQDLPVTLRVVGTGSKRLGTYKNTDQYRITLRPVKAPETATVAPETDETATVTAEGPTD